MDDKAFKEMSEGFDMMVASVTGLKSKMMEAGWSEASAEEFTLAVMTKYM